MSVDIRPIATRDEIERCARLIAEGRIFREHENMFMLVSSFNRDAQRLYARLGYEVVGELKDYVIRGHSARLSAWTRTRQPYRWCPASAGP